MEATPERSSRASTLITFFSPSPTVVLSNQIWRTSGGVESDSEEFTVNVPPGGAVAAEGAWTNEELSAPSVREIHDTYQTPVSASRGTVIAKVDTLPLPASREPKGRVANLLGLRISPQTDFTPDRSSLTWTVSVVTLPPSTTGGSKRRTWRTGCARSEPGST